LLSIRRELLDAKLEKFQYLITGNVLDIGGKKINKRGSFTPPENKNIFWTYLNLFSEENPDVVGNSNKLPFKNDIFDAVIMTEVLEYISRPEVAIKEIERVIKNEGHILLSVPFLNPFHGDYQSDLKRFTESGLRDLISQTNLKIVTLDKMGHIGAVVFDIIRHNLTHSNRSFYQRIIFLILRFLKPLFYLLDSLQNKNNFYITSGYFLVLKK
tara:strand:+ start:667 stop:1305 length:639 start_codon:yes stop_codon:yes gene_type:complete